MVSSGNVILSTLFLELWRSSVSSADSARFFLSLRLSWRTFFASFRAFSSVEDEEEELDEELEGGLESGPPPDMLVPPWRVGAVLL